MIQRKDRKRTLAVLADPNVFGTETGADLFKRLRPQIEALENRILNTRSVYFVDAAPRVFS